MKSEELRRIREKLDMNRDELAQLLCLSGYQAMMNIETGFRRPSKLAIRLLRYLDSLPKAKALALIEELKRHEPN
jgi:DNA-binding XRE family transcriptional regulator